MGGRTDHWNNHHSTTASSSSSAIGASSGAGASFFHSNGACLGPDRSSIGGNVVIIIIIITFHSYQSVCTSRVRIDDWTIRTRINVSSNSNKGKNNRVHVLRRTG